MDYYAKMFNFLQYDSNYRNIDMKNLRFNMLCYNPITEALEEEEQLSPLSCGFSIGNFSVSRNS